MSGMVVNGTFTRTNSFGADAAKVYPRFHTDEVQDMVASEMQGRPIFRSEERVEIILPGNPHTRPVMKVTEEHKQRWPEEYQRFKQGLEMSAEGTPLEEWPRLKRAQVLELKALGFVTVEQIASMPDLATQRVGMGGMGLRNLAKAFLDEAEAHALTERLTAENERRNSENEELRAKVAQMGELVDRLHSELQMLKNAPSPIAAHVPGLSDPVERLKQGAAPEPAAASSLDSLAAPRRGRGTRQPTGDAA